MCTCSGPRFMGEGCSASETLTMVRWWLSTLVKSSALCWRTNGKSTTKARWLYSTHLLVCLLSLLLSCLSYQNVSHTLICGGGGHGDTRSVHNIWVGFVMRSKLTQRCHGDASCHFCESFCLGIMLICNCPGIPLCIAVFLCVFVLEKQFSKIKSVLLQLFTFKP